MNIQRIWMVWLLLLLSPALYAEIKNVSEGKAKILGDCALCQQGIEKAGYEKNISRVSWDKDSKIALITYDNKQTNLDAILKKIALAGYDNERFLAPDQAYAQLADCCQYERMVKTKVNSSAGADHHHLTMDNEPSMAGSQEEPLKDLLMAYYAVKDALVETDGQTAAEQAKNLLGEIKAVKMGQLPHEQHMIWMEVMNDINMEALRISETKDIEKQRNYFSALSENMYKVLKVGKPKEAIYYQHCPMAKGGKGANWLSPFATIKNPYYGAQMLSCGKTTETIQ